MKKNISLKILAILVIIAISLISFIGIFVTDKGPIKDILPEYLLSKDLKGARIVKLVVDKSTNEVVHDANGNVVTDGKNEDGTLKEGYTKEDVKVNSDDVLTSENYELAKVIMEKRLNSFGVGDYSLRKNEQTGEMTLEIAEGSNIDNIIYNLGYLGKFTITDSQTKEVLLSNDNIKKAGAVYSTTETGTRVFLSIEFNNEGKQKLEEITKEYITTTDENGKSETKKISINLDDEKLTETYFAEKITNGILQLSVGNASTDSETISNYLEQASQIGAIIDSGKMPIKYSIESNVNMATTVNLQAILLGIILITSLALIYLCVKYKLNGVLLSISYIGYIALLLIVLRYTNVIISLEGIAGFVILLIANYMFITYVLSKKDKNIKDIIKETYKRYVSIFLPMLIISIIFTFISWTSISSLGMIMFWGLIVMFIYNYIVIKALLSDK